MAQDSTLGGLYLSVGLDISELESDFLAADRTTRENLNRLNRESNLVRLRAEVEIGNLDETADAVQILTVRENALNQQMAMQRDRIRIAEAQLQRLTQQHGESAVVTQRAAAALERERLSLQRLQRELNDVQDAQSNLNDMQGNSNSIFSSLTDNLDDIAGKAAPVVAAIGAMGTAFTAMADAQTRLIENFRELQNQSYELNMPVADTKNFLREMRLAGGDYGDFEGYIRGITDAYVKGEFDDPEFIALSKYGAKITDATGRLKNFKEITEEVYQAYQKAKAAGEGMEFLQLTGGESGIRDAIQYFERYKEAKEDAAKIFDSGINPTELHESERALNLLTEQTNEFQDALANVITPLAQDAMKELFEIVRDGTQFLVENKEEFKSWGFIASEAISTVANAAKEISESEGYKILKKGFDFAGDNLLPSGVLKNNLGMVVNSLIGANGLFGDTWAGIIDRAKDKQIAYNNALNATKASWADFRREVESGNLQPSNPLNQYDTKRITQFRDELEDLRLELKYADDEFALATAQNDLWMERELTRKNFLSPEEETAIRELHAEKQIEIERRKAEGIQKIEEDTQNRIKALTEDTADREFELTHTAFEKQIRAIKQWEQEALASLDKYKDSIKDKNLLEQEAAAIVANALAKEREAFEREMDRIKGKTQDLREKIFEQEHSQRDIDIMRVQKQVAELKKEGIYNDDVINRWAENEYAKIAERSVGNADYIKTPRNRRGGAGGIPVIYGDATEGYGGDFKPSKNFYDEIQQQANSDVANKFGVLTDSTQDLTNAQEELQKSIEIFNGGEWAQSYIQSMENVTNAQDAFADTIAKEGDILAQAIRDTAAKIGNVPLAQAVQPPEEESFINRDVAKVVFDAVQTGGEIAALVGASHANPALGLGGGIAAAAGGVGNMALDALDAWDSSSDETPNAYIPQTNMPDISAAIKDIQSTLSRDIQALSETTVGILQHVEQIAAREPVMNISPTINIDLGGAYVFDDAMKNQLTDDITENVTDAIKDAFNKEVRASSYSYGN